MTTPSPSGSSSPSASTAGSGPPSPALPPALLAVLGRSQELGFLGPGPVTDHVTHALGFARSPAVPAPARFLDLGSGGGLPGLVLSTMAWPSSTGVLLDATARRCAFLEEAIDALGLAPRIEVHRARAEEAGRSPAFRGTFDVVVSRSFASPAVTAECAAPFLRAGGHLIVSEPPLSTDTPTPDRWPPDGLAPLGLSPEATWSTPHAFRVLTQTHPCPDHFPRRTGVPSKRPLF